MGSTFTGNNSTPMNRHVAFICASLLSFLAMGQVAMVKQGQQFERTKNLFGPISTTLWTAYSPEMAVHWCTCKKIFKCRKWCVSVRTFLLQMNCR